MSNLNDFVIKNGVLKKYKGKYTEVVIPDGVTKIGEKAFSWCESLTSITIPDGVTEIGKDAFCNCVSLTGITIPEGVTELWEGAFSWCKSLTSITIPDSVTWIGNSAFEGCKSLTGITIPEGVTEIGNSAFSGCGLTSITIPNSVTWIGNSAFSWCESLTSIAIPNGVTTIGECAFWRCESLTSITIPDSVTTIGNCAFYGCESLKSISIPKGVTKIGKEVFLECEKLKSITIPEGVTEIGEAAFSGCKRLKSITIPDSVTEIGKDSFTGCRSLEEIVAGDISVIPTKCKIPAIMGFANSNGQGSEKRIESHKKYIKTNAEKLVDLAMRNISLLSLMCREKLITPKNLELFVQKANESKNAEANALMLDYSQTKVTAKQKEAVEKKKEAQEEEIFERAIARSEKKGIEGIRFATTGNLFTFKNRDELKECIVKNGGSFSTTISSKVDYLITNDIKTESEKNKKAQDMGIEIITEYDFNEKINRMFEIDGEGVLVKYTSAGEDVVVPDSVTKIGDSAFRGCKSLKSISIPEGVTEIGKYAFCGCKSLKSISVPDSVTWIGDSAFEKCKKLTSITIPDSVMWIGENAFSGCLNLKEIVAGDISVIPTEYKILAITGFINSNGQGSEKRTESHNKYIKTNAAKLVDWAMEDIKLLTLMCRERLITPKNLELYVQKANESKNPEANALMLDYSQTKVTAKKKEAVAKKKESDAEEVAEHATTQIKKEGIEGLCFATTGHLFTFKDRNELKEIIAKNRGFFSTAVSSKVDYLIAAIREDAKTKKAQKMGIEIITEYEFNEKVNRIFKIGRGGVLVKYTGAGGDVVIPDSVTRIGEYAFCGCESLTSITIPKSVTRIGKQAFWSCESLTSITIHDGVTEIGEEAFKECKSLESITMPDSVTKIGDSAFRGCKNLTSITIPEGVTEIGKYAFYGCKGLADKKEFIIINNVLYEYFGDDKDVVIPDGVTEIGERAFYGCESLKSITIPDSVTKIGKGVFWECKKLKSISIPKGVTKIEASAFYGCEKLTIHAPAGSIAEKHAKENRIPFIAE